ncbi:sensor histidine kinase [Paenibacillus puerhi]|uniref:sensor histidine kinase n=1 Tax=Paenibacillus puerhi TaxID=2692622 RepID=UPI0013591CC1|nr:sensor histidine kinase [Paenibacillus puerhi]
MSSNVRSIFYKLLASFLALSVIPLILSSWLTYHYFAEALTAKLDQGATSSMEQKVKTISLYMNDLQRMKQLISNNATVSDYLKNRDADTYLTFFFKLDPLFDSIQAIRPENVGITLVSDFGYVYSYGYPLNRDHADFNSFRWMPDIMSLTYAPYLTSVHDRPYSAEKGNQRVFSYVQRLYSNDLNFKGIMIIDFKPTVFDSLFGSGYTPGNDPSLAAAGMTVTDRDGNVLYPSASPTWTAADRMQTSSGPMNKITNAGKTYLTLQRHDEITDWTITTYFPEEELYRPIRNLQTLASLLILVSVLVCLYASWLISRRISEPIKQLLTYMRSVGRGDFTMQFSLQRKDELGALSYGFNQMVDKLKELIDMVYKEQNEKRRAEITALQWQINPHFLYNTLESINSLARKKKEHEISRMIVLLGKLFRVNIGTFEEFIPLDKELEYIRYYLEIHKLRMPGFLEYQVDVDEEVLHLYTMKWILQPIVENAIIHGLDRRSACGKIEIRGWQEDEDVYLQVRDHGNGIPAALLEEVRTNLEYHSEDLSKYKSKVGLFNVQSRIRLQFGPSYGLHLDSHPDQGTVVTIKLPRRAEHETT